MEKVLNIGATVTTRDGFRGMVIAREAGRLSVQWEHGLPSWISEAVVTATVSPAAEPRLRQGAVARHIAQRRTGALIARAMSPERLWSR